MLEAAKIRAEYRQKKRARRDGDGDDDDTPTSLAKAKKRRLRVDGAKDSNVGGKSTKTQQEATTIEIQPGESLKHFNRFAFACL